MNHQDTLIIPIDIIIHICTFLKFNTKIPLTCKLLYSTSIKALCWTGMHLVSIIYTERRLPERCPCTTDICKVCRCPILPMYVPTRVKYGNIEHGFVCDTCSSGVYYCHKSEAFGVNKSGAYQVYTKIIY